MISHDWKEIRANLVNSWFDFAIEVQAYGVQVFKNVEQEFTEFHPEERRSFDSPSPRT